MIKRALSGMLRMVELLNRWKSLINADSNSIELMFSLSTLVGGRPGIVGESLLGERVSASGLVKQINLGLIIRPI